MLPLERIGLARLLLEAHTVHVVHSLEIFVGLASFTACLVAVDKLYLFYATVFYKGAAMLDYERWEPTLRYPTKWKRGVKPPKVRRDTCSRVCMAAPLYRPDQHLNPAK